MRITDEKAKELSQSEQQVRNKDCVPLKTRIREFSLATSIALALMSVFLFSFPNLKTESVARVETKPSVHAISQSSSEGFLGLHELTDRSALLLPTERNFRRAEFTPPSPEGWELERAGVITYATELKDIKFAELDSIINLDVAKQNFEATTERKMFSAFGRINKTSTRVATNSPNLELVDMQTGKLAYVTRLVGVDNLLSPLTFRVQVFADGSPSAPVTMTSSGDEKKDSQVKRTFMSSSLGKSLREGVYKITVSP